RYSLLPALSLDGVIHVKIVEGLFTTELFMELIEGLLDKTQPFPQPNSVIREFVQKPHGLHAAFVHCAKLHDKSRVL
ncbi:hypothetical protein DFH08DRAFT_696652, partial [Mycena albidolilacea]